MHLTLATLPWILLAGGAAGLVGAMLGTGGGVFLIPVLVLALGMNVHEAIATSIVTVIATSSAVASTNVERGTANMRLGMTLEVATSVGAVCGALTAAWLSPHVLEAGFALILLPTAWLLARGRGEAAVVPGDEATALVPPQEKLGALGARYVDQASGQQVAYRVQRLWGGLAISFLAGNLSGLLGIGGGIFKVPALHLVCNVPMRAAAATSNFMIGVTAAASAFLYYGRGSVRPAVTAAAVLGVLVGSAAGTVVNRHVQASALQKLFAALLLAVSLQMLFRVLRGS